MTVLLIVLCSRSDILVNYCISHTYEWLQFSKIDKDSRISYNERTWTFLCVLIWLGGVRLSMLTLPQFTDIAPLSDAWCSAICAVNKYNRTIGHVWIESQGSNPIRVQTEREGWSHHDIESPLFSRRYLLVHHVRSCSSISGKWYVLIAEHSEKTLSLNQWIVATVSASNIIKHNVRPTFQSIKMSSLTTIVCVTN